MGRSHSIARVVLTLLFAYIVAVGATFNGIITPEFKMYTLAVMALTVAGWLFVRWRRGWQWHRTPLDGAFLLWGLAFGLSLLANGETWRRTAIGLWYMGVYVGVWYALQDALANRTIRPDALIDALLITGLVVMVFGYVQTQNWLAVRLPLVISGAIPFDLPRPVSVLGNANALGSFLAVVTPFALLRAATARNRFGRAALICYAVLAALLAFLTYSRGAWLGLAAALIGWGGLSLAQGGMLSPRRLADWWRALSGRRKMGVISISVSVFAAVLIAGALFIHSFAQPGRSVERRTVLYQPAIDLFLEKPLTGHGLFTFGRGYMRLVSIPPNQPHSHAHDAVLHIAAETGVIGLAALFGTLTVIARTARRNWLGADEHGRRVLAAATAAVSGFALHHLLDTPAMMPAIALTGLLALSLALAPINPSPVSIRWRRLGYGLGTSVLWLGLLLTGLWSSRLYSQYVAVLRDAVSSGDYREAAERLQPIIDADPSLTLYHLEQGYLLGLAASEGDADAAREAIAVYRRYLTLEPQHAIAWANLAALYWQTGQQQEALDVMRRAAELAPESWQLAYNLGAYAEIVGDVDAAREAYGRVLEIAPCAQLYPGWDQTSLRRAALQEEAVPCSGEAATAAGRNVADALRALESGKRDEAAALLARAQAVSTSTAGDSAWIHLGRAQLARFDGDNAAADRELQAARDALEPDLLTEDVAFGANVAHFQFLRTAITRQLLPQVYYPTAAPELLQLLKAS